MVDSLIAAESNTATFPAGNLYIFTITHEFCHICFHTHGKHSVLAFIPTVFPWVPLESHDFHTMQVFAVL